MFVQKYEFIVTLHTLSDVLPPLAQLSRAFQTKDIDFSMVQTLVAATMATIRTLKDHSGEHFQSLPDVLRILTLQVKKQRVMLRTFTKNKCQHFYNILKTDFLM